MNQAAASRLQLLAWCLLAAFPLLALTVDKAASVIFALFVIAGLVILVKRDWPPLHRESRWVLLAFAAYFLASLASFLLGEQTRLGEKILGRDARFLLALPLFFALLKTGFAERWLKLAVAAGGMFTGAWAIGEVIIAGDFSHRASGESISIVFGHLSALLFALNLALLLRGNRQERWLAALGSVFALVAVTFSGTRGALLSVIAAAASGMLMLAWQGRAHRRLVTGSAVIFMVLAACAIGWLWPRISDGIDDVRDWQRASEVAVETRGCVDDEAALRELLRHSRSYRRELSVSVVAVQDAPAECGGGVAHAIRLFNSGDKRARWRSPYRHAAVGDGGEILFRGRATLSLQGGEAPAKYREEGFRRVPLPAVTDIALTRFNLHIAPGDEVLLIPLETLPGEYAFAALESPVGNRLGMWVAALRNIGWKPTGRGTGSWPEMIREEAEAGRAAWRLTGYDHAHSDYLNTLLERGWLGFLALLAVLAAPVAFAVRRLSGWPRGAMILLVISVSVSALTETVFNHSIAITYYCTFAILLMTAARQDEENNGSSIPAARN